MHSLHQSTHPLFQYLTGDPDITPSDIVDLLGVIIEDRLSFGHHVKNILHKAALKINALQWQSKWLDQNVKLDYGRTCVQSNF